MADVVKNATIKNVAFWVCLFFSIGLVIAGFFTPPMGDIDGSVLTAVGELFGFATLYVVYHAIEKGIGVVDVTHYASEVLIVPVLQKKLTEAAKENGWDIEVICSKVNGQTFWNI